VLVTHHPLFAIPVGEAVERAVGRNELALDAIEQAGVDLLLAGHAHHAVAHDASDLVTRAGGALVIQAGTATSVRLREQSQNFNVIDVEAGCMTLTVECWSDDAFSPSDARRYEYRNGHWRILKAEAPAH
jgi:predicted phosphodiesterase